MTNPQSPSSDILQFTEKVDVSKYPGATFLLVEDSILALQQLARIRNN